MRLWCVLHLLLFPVLLLGQSRPEQEAPAQHKSNEAQSVPSTSKTQVPAKQQESKSEEQPPKCPLPVWTDPFWSNWVLVLVTGGAVWAAFSTLGDLKEQTAITKTSAEAAKQAADAAYRSVEAYMDSQSGVLSVVEQEFHLVNDAYKSLVTFRIHNIGLTAITSFASEHLFQLSQSNEEPPTAALYNVSDEVAKSPDVYLPPDKDVPQGGRIGAECVGLLSTIQESAIGLANTGIKFKPNRLTDAEIQELMRDEKFLWCYGFVRYRDTFKRNFEMRFCLRYFPRLVPNGGFGLAGPPQFNRITRYEPKK